MILYVKDQKNSTTRLLDVINTFRKIARHKKQYAFYTRTINLLKLMSGGKKITTSKHAQREYEREGADNRGMELSLSDPTIRFWITKKIIQRNNRDKEH
jgi:hypothetical protein